MTGVNQWTNEERQLALDLERRMLDLLQRHQAMQHPQVIVASLSRMLLLSAYAVYGPANDLYAVRGMVNQALDLVEAHMRKGERQSIQ